MNKVCACIDGRANTLAVIDWAIWSAHRQPEAARQTLPVAGFEVQTALAAGGPEAVLPGLVKAQGAAMLVMGAHGHSRIRQLIVGSTTTTLLRLSEVPVLILR